MAKSFVFFLVSLTYLFFFWYYFNVGIVKRGKESFRQTARWRLFDMITVGGMIDRENILRFTGNGRKKRDRGSVNLDNN
jgi:hypothetical protein